MSALVLSLLHLRKFFVAVNNQQVVLPIQRKAMSATGGQVSSQECAFAASFSTVLAVKVGPLGG